MGQDGLCQCGCGEPTVIATRTDTRQGKIKGQPQKFVLGHSRRKTPEPYRVDPETGCWIWLRSTINGYGAYRKDGYNLAHRYYYAQKFGPIPPELPLDHLCRTPLCCNPDHLEPVTTRVNILRSTGTKLTDEAVAVARAAIENGAGLRATARALGVSHNALWLRLKR